MNFVNINQFYLNYHKAQVLNLSNSNSLNIVSLVVFSTASLA
jgi:hypothetical protein